VVATLVAVLLAATPAAFAAVPANDAFADATVVGSLPFTDAQNTEDATTQPGDPECAGNGHTVWYSFTPSAAIELEAHTFGSDYDTTVSAWTAEAIGLAQVACNDDAGGTLQSRIRFDALADETYYIRVGSFYDSPGGNMMFLLREAPPLGPPPVLELSIDPTGSVNRNGVARIRGTLTCSEPIDAFVDLFVRQTTSRPIVEGYGSAFVQCSGPTAWEAQVYPFQGAFVAGPVSVTGSAFACDLDEQCGEAQATQTVVLRTGGR
jgi:hypothetical protein